MTIKIDLPESHTVTKGPRDKAWTASVTVDLAKLSPEIVARLAVHGLQQKIADAASGAATADEANAAMNKAVDAILAGEWTSRTAGEGVSEEVAVGRMVVRKAVKAKFGSKSPEWAKFTGLEPAEQNAKLDEWLAANAETFAEPIAEALAARAKERADKAKLAKAANFAI
jgi:hypothetical protein